MTSQTRENGGVVASPPPQRTLLAGKTLTVLMILASALALVTAWRTIAQRSFPIDFYQFWAVGQSLGQSDLNIYSDKAREQLGETFSKKMQASEDSAFTALVERRKVLQTYSSPLLYSSFRVFSTGNFKTDLAIYRLATFLCYVLSIILFCRLLRYKWEMMFGVLAFFLAWYDPFYSDVIIGNVNCFQLMTLAIYLWITCRSRSTWRSVLAGICLGLATAYKPNIVLVPVALAMMWILQRRYVCLALHILGGLAGIIAAIVFSSLIFKSAHCWTDWLAAVRSMPEAVTKFEAGNFAPGPIIGEWLKTDVTLIFDFILGGCIILGIFPWRKRREQQTKHLRENEITSDVLTTAIGGLLTVLAFRLAWYHYYVLAVPAFIFLFSSVGLSSSDNGFKKMQRTLVILAFTCFALNSLAQLQISFNLKTEALLTLAGSLLLFMLAVFSLKKLSTLQVSPSIIGAKTDPLSVE